MESSSSQLCYPMGLLVECLDLGPITGNRHDAYTFAESGLILKLSFEFMAEEGEWGQNANNNTYTVLCFTYMLAIQLIYNQFTFLKVQKPTPTLT